MKKQMAELMLLAGLLGGGLGNAPLLPAEYPKKRKAIIPKLTSYKHSGHVPIGCKLETITLTFYKNQEKDKLSIEVDIIYGSEKAKQKRIIKFQKEIEAYILHLPIDEIIKRNEFKHELTP